MTSLVMTASTLRLADFRLHREHIPKFQVPAYPAAVSRQTATATPEVRAWLHDLRKRDRASAIQVDYLKQGAPDARQ
jgi:hypothetical protein